MAIEDQTTTAANQIIKGTNFFWLTAAFHVFERRWSRNHERRCRTIWREMFQTASLKYIPYPVAHTSIYVLYEKGAHVSEEFPNGALR